MGVAWAAEAAGTGGGGGGYWQLVMVLAGIGFLGLFARWRRSRAPALPSAREMRQRDEDPNRYRDTADKAIVELLETSRVLNAQVDTKIRVLNRLVKEAEDKIASLEGLLADTSREGNTGGGTENDAANAVSPTALVAAKEEKPRAFMSDLHERIHRLGKEGKTVAEIAKATNLSTTEVEFIVKTL